MSEARVPEDRDSPERVQARSSQEDPWVMYLVVRADAAASEHEVLLAAAAATMRCVAAYIDAPAWSDAFHEWAGRSFRKVTLRAKGSAWAKLAAYDAGVALVDGQEVVRVLPPRRRSACDSFVRNLQVYNPERASLRPAPVEAPASPAHAMTFAFNPHATMSVGKAVAQVSHAVLLCAWSPLACDPRHEAAFTAWEREGFPGRIAAPDAWDTLRARPDACVVRDAGLTEVTPGTETVLALPPGIHAA